MNISTPILLWTNPNIGTQTRFVDQTIAIDNISIYRIIFIVCGCYYANGPFVSSTFAFRDVLGSSGIAVNKESDNWGTRTFTIEQTGVRIRNAYYETGTSQTIENSRCWPIQIYGIK